MRNAAIGLMARYPELGKVKTRLAKTIGDEPALSVYNSLLSQSCRLVQNLEATEFYRFVFLTPENISSSFEAKHSCFDQYYEQQGEDLGERMQNAIYSILSLSAVNKAILIGADCPELTKIIVEKALELLDKNDLVLGPTSDGGYYLIGMKNNYPELFSGINWGTNTVMNKTLIAANSLKLRVGSLIELRDLDDEDDYNFFRSEGLLSSN